MKSKGSVIVGSVLAACFALPSWVSAAPPTGALSYFCSGHGDVILGPSTAPCDADVAVSGDILSNIVVPTCTSNRSPQLSNQEPVAFRSLRRPESPAT